MWFPFRGQGLAEVKQNLLTMKKFTPLLFTLFTLSAFAQSGPVGWASLNGGTTGGEGGEVVTITNRAELLANVAGTTPKILMIEDTIELVLYEKVKVYANKTIVGKTQNAMIRFGGLEIVGNNVILQNLVIGDFYDGDWGGTTHSTDCLTIYGVNVWIDHCWFWAGADGLLDIRSGNGSIADYITVSYCKFSDHNKVTLVGAGDDATQDRDHLRVTFHHCWYDATVDKGLNQRMPRVRFGDVHVFNNYYEELDSYGVAARFESDVVVENTYFRNSKNPHIMDDIGLGLEDPDLVAINNIYEQCTGSQTTSGAAFVPGDFYNYTPTPTWDVPALVMNEAGPFNPAGNIAPVAVDDIIYYAGMAGAVTIFAADNDTDADGGDLRIAQIANDPPGNAFIKLNRITYFPLPNSTGVDTILYTLVDTQGGVDTGMVLIDFDNVNAAGDLEAESALIHVYPNPTNGLTTIEIPPFAGEAELRLFDSRGRQISCNGHLSFEQNKYTLDAGFLSPGVYLVSFQTNNHVFSKKLIINK